MAKIRFILRLKVKHYHKTSGIEWFKHQIDRGYWCYKIYKKHRNNNIKDEPMFSSISIKNFFMFPFWISFQFFQKNKKNLCFVLVSEIGWRIGIIKGMIS